MKTLVLATALAGLSSLGAVGLATGSRMETVQVGDPAPEVGGEWLQSEASSLAELRGRVVLIEFWRTW